MSVISKAEQAAEAVFRDVEAGVKDVDGAALHEARELLAEAKTAADRVVELAGQYKAEITAVAEKVAEEDAPAIEAALVALGERLLADITGLFAAEE
jgi:cell division septum initiation protein DivIVA